MNTASRYSSLIDRYWLISFVRQSNSNSVTYKELLEYAPPLSERTLCRHLKFISDKRYLLKEKKRGSYSIYSFNPSFKEKFERIDSVFDTWLAYSTLNIGKVWFDTHVMDETTPQKFEPIIDRLVGDKAAIERFETEFRRIGVEL